MQIEITPKQYKDLIMMSSIACSVFSMLGDRESSEGYKEQSLRMDALEAHLLEYAKEFGCDELAMDDEGAMVLDDEYYEEIVMPVLYDYDEMQIFDDLANKLAWRDFRNKYSAAELKAMSKENGGYFGVSLYEYEKKYWDEFDEHGFDKLEIKE